LPLEQPLFPATRRHIAGRNSSWAIPSCSAQSTTTGW
jgi:hypothetical protein